MANNDDGQGGTKKGPTNKKRQTRTKPDSNSMRRVKSGVVRAEGERTASRVKSNKPPTRRKDWRDNHAKVLDAFLRLLKTYKRKPTLDELASSTGLSIKSISEHLKASDFSDTVEDLRILTSQVLMGIYTSAMSGKTQSQRLWLEVVEGWKPKDAGPLLIENNSVIILPSNNREDKSAEVQGWTETDWDELNEEQNRQE